MIVPKGKKVYGAGRLVAKEGQELPEALKAAEKALTKNKAQEPRLENKKIDKEK